MTRWLEEATKRYPDDMDMVDAPYGQGRWATVAWCTGLTVQLHRTRANAEKAIADIDRMACGHDCWRDHELVDLAAAPPSRLSPIRVALRVAHFTDCGTCDYVFSGKAATAAYGRHGADEVTAPLVHAARLALEALRA